MEHIFVYGSLRKGMQHHQRYLKDQGRFQSYGYIKGKLYALQGHTYPALVEGEGYVRGEIYTVDKRTAAQIDELEGYIEGEVDSEYWKVYTMVYDECKNAIGQYPVYYYNVDRAGNREKLKEWIEDGDFVRYQGEHTK